MGTISKTNLEFLFSLPNPYVTRKLLWKKLGLLEVP